MNVVGLDLSLTATGVATASGTEVLCTSLRGCERLAWLRDQVMVAVALHDLPSHQDEADFVVMEGFSFNSRNTQAHANGGLGWIVRLALHEAAIPWVEVPPATLKKYATGHGNAGKGEVLAAAIRRLGYDGHDDNEADALWLRAMALDHYEGRRVVPQGQHDALAKVEWPELPVAA